MYRFFLIASLLCISVTSSCQNVDIDILKNINLNRNKNLDPAFRFISNTVTPISIATPVIIVSAGFIRKDSVVKRKGFYVASTVLGAAIISTGLKYSVNRTRPFVTYPFLEKAGTAGSHSFPSGHTSSSFATATSLSIAFPKWYVIVPSFIWAGSVAYSRMDLGVHYPSDVLAGAIIGSGSAYVCYRVNKWLVKKREKKLNK